ncbi:MAG TPA: M48 family metalloprotease [Vicinamibacterales bacterium]
MKSHAVRGMGAPMLALLLVAGTAAPALAGDAAGQLGSIIKRGQQLRDIQMTDEEEQQLGAAVSERIRARYGVVQDPAIHTYVTLVGTLLAQASDRPDLDWRFIVLDTDGVNALAAPGGYIHITRGALSLMKDEAALAGVLGHEVIHVTEKHTIRAIQKGKTMQLAADETLGDRAVFNRLVDRATDVVMAGFGRSEELESDQKGVVLANTVGYQPAGLSRFLQTLADRNKASTEKQGLFASHPEMKERLEKLAKTIESKKLNAAADVQARFRSHVTYEPVPLTAIATVEEGSAGLAGGGSGGGKQEEQAKKEEEPKKKRGFGLARLTAPLTGGERRSAENTASTGSRGVDTERNARGGSNPAPVPVTVTAAELTAFRKEGGLN